jgi:hypothetical protein
VIVRCLHGFGDSIQFIRFARHIRDQAAMVTVESHPATMPLLANVDGVDQVTTWGGGNWSGENGGGKNGAPSIEWEQQVEVNELPRIFRVTERTISRTSSYITVPERELSASPLLSARHRRNRVGLVWASSTFDSARSIPLRLLARALADLPWDLYSLQHGPERAQMEEASLPPVLCAREQDSNLLHTAADMMHLDLVISVDTVTAHLAGALGRPVWTLLPFEADWRWMLDRSDSPWYPSMRLFRQKNQGDWTNVLAELRDAAFSF